MHWESVATISLMRLQLTSSCLEPRLEHNAMPVFVRNRTSCRLGWEGDSYWSVWLHLHWYYSTLTLLSLSSNGSSKHRLYVTILPSDNLFDQRLAFSSLPSSRTRTALPRADELYAIVRIVQPKTAHGAVGGPLSPEPTDALTMIAAAAFRNLRWLLRMKIGLFCD